VTLQHWIRISKQSSICQDQPTTINYGDCRYNVPVVSPGKTSEKNIKSKQPKYPNQNNQNGFYDINIEGKGQCKHSLPVTVPIKTVQRIIQDYRVHRAVRVPQGLEGLSPLPQKAWCGGCPAAGVYCAGWHAGLTQACIAHPLPCLHAHPWRPGRTPSCLHSGHPLSCSIADNHICICIVLLSFFSLLCFSRGHNWDIIPASRHKEGESSVLLGT